MQRKIARAIKWFRVCSSSSVSSLPLNFKNTGKLPKEHSGLENCRETKQEMKHSFEFGFVRTVLSLNSRSHALVPESSTLLPNRKKIWTAQFIPRRLTVEKKIHLQVCFCLSPQFFTHFACRSSHPKAQNGVWPAKPKIHPVFNSPQNCVTVNRDAPKLFVGAEGSVMSEKYMHSSKQEQKYIPVTRVDDTTIINTAINRR